MNANIIRASIIDSVENVLIYATYDVKLLNN